MKTAEGKRKITGGTFLRRLILLGLLVYVVNDPLGAATLVHNIAYWIGSWFS
jgi:hypothetical protein